MIRVVDLDASRIEAWQNLFEACASGCYCAFWHFEGTKNEWLARCAHEPHANRTAQTALVASGDPRGRGLLAVDDGTSPAPPGRGPHLGEERAVGWMKVVPRACVPKLRRLPVYRALSLGDDEGVWSIACFLVRPDRRRRGVARALLLGAQARLPAWGGRTLEAYPRRSGEPIHDEEMWMGPLELFTAEGFEVRHDDGPYPVLSWQRAAENR